MINLTNDQKVKYRRYRKVLRIFIILFSLATVIFACCSLIYNISPIYAVICLLIEYILNKVRDKFKYKEESSTT